MANAEVEGTGQTGQVQTDHGHTGKYTILMELGSGGSATVSAALSTGIAGFSKVVVLKTIRDGLSQDEATIRMFLGEARLSARMNHPNVVQVYEVFLRDTVPVIVMEFLDGQPLSSILVGAYNSKSLTIELAVVILTKVLAGLHYAHSLCDFTGEPLQLIHRELPGIEREFGVQLRFLAGIGRQNDYEWDLDLIARIQSLAGSVYVAGVDFMGQEVNSTRDFARQIEQFEDPTSGRLLQRHHSGSRVAHPGVLVPRADQPVGGERGWQRAADHPAVEPP